MFGERREVLGLRAVGEDPGVQSRVQRLHATVQHLGKARHVGDFEMLDAGRAQCRGGATGRHQFNAVRGESLAQFDQSGLVPDRK